MKGGKLDDSVLKKAVFDNITHKRKEIIVGSGTGIDSCVIDIGADLAVVTTDPVTAASNNIGRLCANICCNDIAATGAEPVAILITMLVPDDYDTEKIEGIIKDLDKECVKLNIQLAGGHTEKTDAVNRLVMSATVIGRKKSHEKKKVNEGDVLIMTKSAGLEGGSIIASDYEDKLKGILSEEEIIFLKNLISDISVLTESRTAVENGAKYMHDITEGGVLGAAWEMSRLAGCNVEIWCDEIFIHEEIKKLCEYFNIDPLRLISSGSLLIASGAKDADKTVNELKKQKIRANIIGRFTGGKSVYIRHDKIYDLNEPQKDEIYKL
jgi:hydrogenase expression/formation protein HypE